LSVVRVATVGVPTNVSKLASVRLYWVLVVEEAAVKQKPPLSFDFRQQPEPSSVAA